MLCIFDGITNLSVCHSCSCSRDTTRVLSVSAGAGIKGSGHASEASMAKGVAAASTAAALLAEAAAKQALLTLALAPSSPFGPPGTAEHRAAQACGLRQTPPKASHGASPATKSPGMALPWAESSSFRGMPRHGKAHRMLAQLHSLLAKLQTESATGLRDLLRRTAKPAFKVSFKKK